MENVILNKCGENWLQMSVDRTPRGILIWVKADPRIEEFFAAISRGGGEPITLSEYGNSWVGKRPEKINVYYINRPIDCDEYVVGKPCTPLTARHGATNLSFLHFVGVGSPEGVSFEILEPAGKPYLQEISRNILRAARQLIKDHIAPVGMRLRISLEEI